VEITDTMPAPADRVYRALTSAVEQSAAIGGHVVLEARAGGSVTWSDGRLGHVAGTILELAPNEQVVISLSPQPSVDGWGLGPQDDPCRLELLLEPDAATCRLTVRQLVSSAEQVRFLSTQWHRSYLLPLKEYLLRIARLNKYAETKATIGISPRAAFLFEDESVVLVSGDGGQWFRLAGFLAYDVLRLFMTARARDQALAAVGPNDRGSVEEVIEACIGAGILAATEQLQSADPATCRWEPHDLLFHQISTRFANVGWHCLGMREPSPAAKPPMSTVTVPLDDDVDFPAVSLAATLRARRSMREFDRRPMTTSVLSALLAASARNSTAEAARRWNHDWMPGTYVSRPYPSGGALHSLELYVVLDNEAVDAVGLGIYHYCPEYHRLERLSDDAKLVRLMLDVAPSESMVRPPRGVPRANVVPPALIVVTSRFDRVSYKYGGHAYSLVLREVGGLLQTLNLVSTALGLAGCVLGGGAASRLFPQHLSLAPLVEPVLGNFMFGPAWSGHTETI
jgi:SagB-type dehydrogenase family enzyme